MIIDAAPTLILTGAYGSGKTEIAMALATLLAAETPTALVDLDFVTPYFRVLDHRAALEALGVQVIAPEARVAQIDAPSLPAAAGDALCRPTGRAIVDLGGDAVGAVVLGQYAPRLTAYDLWAVVNFSRPTTETPAAAQAWLAAIIAATRLRLTGLISNTHLGVYTTAEDVLTGLAGTRALGEALGVPVTLCCAPAGLEVTVPDVPVLAITPRLHRPWER
jgi:hypothetical protein